MVRTSRRGRDNPGSTPGGDSLTWVQVTLSVLGSLGMCILVFSGHVVLGGRVGKYSLERVVLNPTLATPGHSLIFVLPG